MNYRVSYPGQVAHVAPSPTTFCPTGAHKTNIQSRVGKRVYSQTVTVSAEQESYCSLSLELQASTILCINWHFWNSWWKRREQIQFSCLQLQQKDQSFSLTWLMRMLSLECSCSVSDWMSAGAGGIARIMAVQISTWMWRKLFQMYLKYISWEKKQEERTH